MKVTIELQEMTVATRDGASVVFDPAKIDEASRIAIATNLLMYGVGQKVRDSRSAAKSADESLGMMQKCLDGLYAGEWSQRGTGAGVDEATRVGRSIMRKAIRANADAATWKAFTELSEADQTAKLDANLAANLEALQPAIDEEIARRAKQRKADAAIKGKVSIAL